MRRSASIGGIAKALESVASLDMHENLNQNDLSNYPHLKTSASALHI